MSLVLVLGWWWLHRMSLGVFLSLQYSGRVWEGSVKVFFFFNVWKNLPVKSSAPGFCLQGGFALLPDPVLVGCICVESCPFFLSSPVCWHTIVHSILSFFCISAVSAVISPLIRHFIWVFFLSPWWPWPEVCQFCLSFQRNSSWFDSYF